MPDEPKYNSVIDFKEYWKGHALSVGAYAVSRYLKENFRLLLGSRGEGFLDSGDHVTHYLSPDDVTIIARTKRTGAHLKCVVSLYSNNTPTEGLEKSILEHFELHKERLKQTQGRDLTP